MSFFALCVVFIKISPARLIGSVLVRIVKTEVGPLPVLVISTFKCCLPQVLKRVVLLEDLIHQ